MSSELSDNEKQLLAREVAADRFDVNEDSVELTCEECGSRDIYYDLVPLKVTKDAVKYGWDAAIEYVKE